MTKKRFGRTSRPDGPPAAVAWSQGVTCNPGAFHYRRVGTGASTPMNAGGTNKSTSPAGTVSGAGNVCLDTIRRKPTIPRQPDTAERSVQSTAPPLPRPGHCRRRFADSLAEGTVFRTIGPAVAKGLSAIAEGTYQTDKLDGVIKHRSSREMTMVGGGAFLDGRGRNR
jgi:hypothetical protein